MKRDFSLVGPTIVVSLAFGWVLWTLFGGKFWDLVKEATGLIAAIQAREFDLRATFQTVVR